MADQLIMEKDDDQSAFMDTSDLAAAPYSKPTKLSLKLKISQRHVCPVCKKVFTSGKALGGHIRIHMKGNRKISKLKTRMTKKRISNNNIDLNDPKCNEKLVSCCICNKDFRSMKSLFGHMRNHPDRGWRGIRPPSSDKNSGCSSVCENDEAYEISCATEKGGSVSGSDLMKSLPKWTNTNVKRCGISSEIPEAAYCLMKLARGDSLNLGQSSSVGYQRKHSPTDKLARDKTRPLGLGSTTKASSEKKKGSSSRWDQERSVPWVYKRPAAAGEEKKTVKSELKNKMTKLIDYADGTKIVKKDGWFEQFQKFSMKPDEKEVEYPSTMEEEEGANIILSSQTPPPTAAGFYPKNPTSSGEALPNETAAAAAAAAASPGEGKHLYSKTLFPQKTTRQATHGNQVCSHKIRDFDLNEPYVDFNKI